MLPNLHLIGIQGSGKGTQAERLVRRFKLHYIGSGDLFRRMAAAGGQLGREIEGLMSAGRLLPDRLLREAVTHELTLAPGLGIVGDGVLRTTAHLELLHPVWREAGLGEPFLIHLLLDDSEAERRVLLRSADPSPFSGKAGKRADDNPLAIRERITLFRRLTEPLIEAYRSGGRVLSIDGSADADQVEAAIAAGLSALESAWR